MSDTDCSDVYDWPEELPVGRKLSAFEQLLLCPICQGFLNNAHMLKCGHSYCSICIRKHLDSTLNRTSSDTCPSCREKADSFDLKKNTVLSNIVRSFRSMRSDVLKSVQSRNVPESVVDDGCQFLGTANVNGLVAAKGTAIVKRIPHYSFHGMKKDKVKTTLAQLTADSKVKIRMDGEKDTLERRLREFIHLHNAQIGSEDPLSMEGVIKALNESETQLEKESYKTSRSASKLEKVRNGEVVKDVETNFNRLVQKVREQKDLALKKIAAAQSDPAAPTYASSTDLVEPVARTRSASKGSLSQSSHASQQLQHVQSGSSAAGSVAVDPYHHAATSTTALSTTAALNNNTSNVTHSLPSMSQSAELVGRLENLLERGYDWGPWRVVMSQRLGRPFFYNSVTKIGQFAVPPELNVVPSPTQSPVQSQSQTHSQYHSGVMTGSTGMANVPSVIYASAATTVCGSAGAVALGDDTHGPSSGLQSMHYSAPAIGVDNTVHHHGYGESSSFPSGHSGPGGTDAVEQEFTEYLRACDEEEESPFHLLWDGDADYPGSGHPQHTFHHDVYSTSHTHHHNMGAPHTAGFTNLGATACSTAIDLPNPTPFPRDAHYSGFTSASGGSTSYSHPGAAHVGYTGAGIAEVDAYPVTHGVNGSNSSSSSRRPRNQQTASSSEHAAEVQLLAVAPGPGNSGNSSGGVTSGVATTASATSTSAAFTTWSCSACTYLNVAEVYTCEICHTVDAEMQSRSSKPLLRSRNGTGSSAGNGNTSQGSSLFAYGSQNPRNSSGSLASAPSNASLNSGRKTKGAVQQSSTQNKKAKK